MIPSHLDLNMQIKPQCAKCNKLYLNVFCDCYKLIGFFSVLLCLKQVVLSMQTNDQIDCRSVFDIPEC